LGYAIQENGRFCALASDGDHCQHGNAGGVGRVKRSLSTGYESGTQLEAMALQPPEHVYDQGGCHQLHPCLKQLQGVIVQPCGG
jgi:hypothetical protein